MYLSLMQHTELLKGTLQTIILKLLSDQEKMYGYEITQKVKEMSGGKMILTEGALYPTLHKMVSAGYLTTETRNLGKRVRKYYKLTGNGNVTAANKVREFVDFVKVMSKILEINPQLR
jgi:DNA-binding PadR family transcriptional regulator